MNADDIFRQARIMPDVERTRFISDVCAHDPELRAQVESLLLAEAKARDLQHTAEIRSDSRAEFVDAADTGPEGPGARIGLYRISQLIGEGGFGSVFLAEQEQPVKRQVALKIIKLGMDTRRVVARFEQERQALAMMDHPNIAKVLDAGATQSGRPFFVMEFVRGEPIVDYCDRNSLSIHDRLGLFLQVCQAVQHAHTKGIIHRDIKPSNILVSTPDGKPLIKVIDFGIAKATASHQAERTLFTEHNTLVGTPEYMSPEQAEGSPDIDTRTDVYSLGVLLYELLTGTTPFAASGLRSAAYAEMQRIIREVEPPKPSTRVGEHTDSIAAIATRRHVDPNRLTSTLRGELDWIVMKALEKDRQRRYETANGLRMDIQRYLEGEAVLAAPPSVTYRFRKFARRNRPQVIAAGVVTAALILGLAGTAWQARVAATQRDRAIAAERETALRATELERVSSFQAEMLRSVNATDAGSKLMTRIRERFGAALKQAGLPDSERAQREDEFSQSLAYVNATDTASEMIEQVILTPSEDAVKARFADQPELSAALQDTLASQYRNLGLNEKSLLLAREALQARTRLFGESDLRTLESASQVGSLLAASENLDEAEALFRRVLDERTRILGPDHRLTLQATSNLGNFYRERGMLDRAEPLLRAALEQNRRILGVADRSTLVSMNTLGQLFIAKDSLQEAEALWREAYETGRKTFGDDNRDVLVWTANLGGLMRSARKRDEAEKYMKLAMDGFRRVLGENHPDTIMVIGSYASQLNAFGNVSDAEKFARESYRRALQTLGPLDPVTTDAAARLGGILSARGKQDEAETLLFASWEARKRTLGEGHPQTIEICSLLARVLERKGQMEESANLQRRNLEQARSSLGNEHQLTLAQVNQLGTLLLAQDKMDDAEPLVREAAEKYAAVLGPDHPQTIATLTNLGRLLELRNKPVESEVIYREVLEKYTKRSGPDDLDTLIAGVNLALTLRKLQRSDEALALYRNSQAGFSKIYGPEHLYVALAQQGVGSSLTDLGQFAQAEQELLQVNDIMTSIPSLPPARKQRLVTAFVTLYEAWDKSQPGQGYDVQAAEWKAKLDPPPSEQPKPESK